MPALFWQLQPRRKETDTQGPDLIEFSFSFQLPLSSPLMSQQKQQSWEPPISPKCSLPQRPNPSLAACSAPCHGPCSGGCDSGSQKPGEQRASSSRKAHRKKPCCLSGGTVYHIKEEECWGDQPKGEGHRYGCSLPSGFLHSCRWEAPALPL